MEVIWVIDVLDNCPKSLGMRMLLRSMSPDVIAVDELGGESDIEDAIAALEKKPASTKPGTSDKSPQTGDTSNVALWIALLFVSGGAAIGATVVSRKKKYNR